MNDQRWRSAIGAPSGHRTYRILTGACLPSYKCECGHVFECRIDLNAHHDLVRMGIR